MKEFIKDYYLKIAEELHKKIDIKDIENLGNGDVIDPRIENWIRSKGKEL